MLPLKRGNGCFLNGNIKKGEKKVQQWSSYKTYVVSKDPFFHKISHFFEHVYMRVCTVVFFYHAQVYRTRTLNCGICIQIELGNIFVKWLYTKISWNTLVIFQKNFQSISRNMLQNALDFLKVWKKSFVKESNTIELK